MNPLSYGHISFEIDNILKASSSIGKNRWEAAFLARYIEWFLNNGEPFFWSSLLLSPVACP
jgi:hypothetical protein